MSASVRELFKTSFLITMIGGGIVLVPVLLFWPESDRLLAAGGLIWGIVIALAGLLMICTLASSLSPTVKKEKNRAAAGYAVRYGMYALALFIGAFVHFPILMMLAGIMVQKASLFLYALRQRKDRK